MFVEKIMCAMRASELRSAKPIGCACRALVIASAAASCLAAQSSFAAGKQPLDWQRATTVEAPTETDSGNSACQQISSNISKHVASIKALQAESVASDSGPPPTLKAALEDMFGTRKPNAKELERQRKIKAERKSADELNVMMQSSRCKTIDIDAAIANHTVQKHAAPVVPKAIPDDLVRMPQRY